MERGVRIVYWRKENPRDELSGVLEDLKAGDVFYLAESGNRNRLLKAVVDADVKEHEVYVPSEDYTHPFENLFGKADYDKEGHLKFSYADVDYFGQGFEIRYGAKGFGFGGVSLAFREGEKKTLRTDTECTGLETLTAIFRAAAPALAKLALERDPSYRRDQGLSTLEEHDEEIRLERIAKYDREMAEAEATQPA